MKGDARAQDNKSCQGEGEEQGCDGSELLKGVMSCSRINRKSVYSS